MRELAELISDVRSFPLVRLFTHDRPPETFLLVAIQQKEQIKQKS